MVGEGMMQRGSRAEVEAVDDVLADFTETELRRLAFQTRSVVLRDYLARKVLQEARDYDDFLAMVREETPRAFLKPRSAALLARIVVAQRTRPDDPLDALAIYDRIIKLYGVSFLNDNEKLVYADLLDRAGRSLEAVDAIKSLGISETAPADAAALVSNSEMTQTGAASTSWLDAFNAVFRVDGLDPVALAPGTAPELDRLESTSPAASVDGPLVTVIVPTWRPGAYLWTAVRSLVQQTYANLEVLIMDDASGAEYEPLLEQVLALDSRVRVVVSPENRGTYASRNAAVRDHSHGDFITIQDDDDWSHPQRIERQVSASQSRRLAIEMARAARVTEDLRFVRRGASFVRRGYPTTLISRATFADIGFWDPVRRNSDFEFIRRARNVKKPLGDFGQAPLMLQRHRDGSLSSSEVWEGYSEQSRRWQNWLSEEWHRRCTSTGRRAYMGTGRGLPRPYAAPLGLMRNGKSNEPTKVDALIISDFGLGNPAESFSLELAERLLAENKTVGLLHLDGLRPLVGAVSSEVASLTRKRGVSILSWGEWTVSETAHIVDPSSMTLCDAIESEVTANNAVVYGDEYDVKSSVQYLFHLEDQDAICWAEGADTGHAAGSITTQESY